MTYPAGYMLLAENILVASAGGALGVAIAYAAVNTAPSILPPGTLPPNLVPALDGRVLVFTAALSVITGVLFGLAPAWQAARIPLYETLRSGRGTTSRRHFREILAAFEIALALVLLAGAGLLLRTLQQLQSVQIGFRPENVLTGYISLPRSRYPGPIERLRFFEAAKDEISSLPGVRSAAFGSALPLDGFNIGQGFQVIGRPEVSDSRRPAAHYQMVTENYFETLGIRLLRGRFFTERDNPSSTPVCIVNEEFVRRQLPGQDAIGVRVRVEGMGERGPEPVVRLIVGVIGQVKVQDPGEENLLEIYVPLRQNPWNFASLAVRTNLNPSAMSRAVQDAILRVDKDQPISDVGTMDDIVATSVARPRFRAVLVGAFAAVALLLASIGVFGVMAFSVAQRTREFGVRMALGALARQVMVMVAWHGLQIALVGTVAGLCAAFWLTRYLQTLLFEVVPADPVTFAAAPLLLICLALLACVVPARRATRVDPVVTLRQE